MKYEPVFGDKYLADKFTNERSVFIVDRGGVYFEFEDGSAGVNYIANFCAIGDRYYMRRIIAEPKRWTVEDQKAGLLPDVGAKVDGGKVVFVNGFNVVTELKSGAVIVSSPKTFLNTFNPIETPEEKAQREEDEFIDSLSGTDIHDGTVKDFFAQGARAAYRKLKGGE